MKRTLILAAALALAAPASAHPAFLDGNELHDVCRDPARRTSCIRYVMGVYDALQLVRDSLPPGEIHGVAAGACAPSNANNHQMADIVAAHLRTRPQDRHNGAAGLVWAALSSAFPCARAELRR